jgi:predicted transcriptional regulator
MTDKNGSPQPLDTAFGPLEIRVLESLWSRSTPSCVRDIQPDFPGVAYTTLMTTLDRLYRKGTLQRSKLGRAFYYKPKSTQQGLISELAGSTFATLLPTDSASLRPIMSMFVDTVGQRDQELLDELETLVRTRRQELKARARQ